MIRLQPYAIRRQPHVLRLQPYVLRLQPYVLQVADDVYEMLQWQREGAPKPLRWHAQQQARYAYFGHAH